MSLDKTALITGSTDPRAIGFTAGTLLANTGNFGFVILSGRRKEAAESAAAQLQSLLPHTSQTKIGYLVLNVTDSSSIKDAVKQLTSPDGPLGDYAGRLDVLVNNAGVGSPPGRDTGQSMFLQTELTTSEDIINVMATNVGAVVELTNALLPLLSKSSSPRIVNTSSARGSLTFESGLPAERTGALVYNASKCALNMVTIMQSKNLPSFAPGIKVNAASPGHVKTPFNHFTGTRTLEQGANVIAHLATLPDNGPTGHLIGDHAPFSHKDGEFVQIPW